MKGKMSVFIFSLFGLTIGQFSFPQLYGDPTKSPIDVDSVPYNSLVRYQEGSIVKGFQPNMVFLLCADTRKCGGICTASLISPTRILTAAHCFDTMKGGDPWAAVLGLLNVTVPNINAHTDNSKVNVLPFSKEDVVIHPNYHYKDKKYPVNDVAIIKLKEPVKKVFHPITLASSFGSHTIRLKGMGWGMNNCTSYNSMEALREADAFYVDPMSCGLALDKKMDDSELCVLLKANGKMVAAAPGDSGGPIFSIMEPQNPVQIGIASWSFNQPGPPPSNPDFKCRDKKRPNVFSRVAVLKEFIKTHAPHAKFSP